MTLRAIATPGHTPDHHVYVLEHGGTPAALFTGGSLMVGAVGRTDLCGPELAEPLAHEMFHSLRRLDGLPDDLAVYPTHGAGSFCSAPGGAERTTTLGRERATNPLFRIDDEDTFVEQLLAGFGSFPTYFTRLPELNRRGPRRYAQLPRLDRLDVDTVDRHVAAGALVVDVRPIAEFAAGHIPGSMSNALRPVFASWLGWLADLDRPIVIVAGADQDRDEIVRQCLDIGHENIVGELDGGIDAWRAAGRQITGIPLVDPGRDRRHGDRRPPAQRVRRRSRPRRDQHRARHPRPQPRSGRTGDGDVRARRTGHDRRQHPHRPRPPRRVGARRRPRHLGGIGAASHWRSGDEHHRDAHRRRCGSGCARTSPSSRCSSASTPSSAA